MATKEETRDEGEQNGQDVVFCVYVLFDLYSVWKYCLICIVNSGFSTYVADASECSTCVELP